MTLMIFCAPSRYGSYDVGRDFLPCYDCLKVSEDNPIQLSFFCHIAGNHCIFCLGWKQTIIWGKLRVQVSFLCYLRIKDNCTLFILNQFSLILIVLSLLLSLSLSSSCFRLIGEESLAEEIFEEYVLRLQEKAKEKERKREEEKVTELFNVFSVSTILSVIP